MTPNTPVSESEARRLARLDLALPIRVEGKIDKNIGWSEITRLKDVSAFGCGFHLSRPVKRGRLLALTMPMPRQLRCFDYLEPQYKIWALIRRCLKIEAFTESETYAVGVAFIGKYPPLSYIDDPNKLYDSTHLEEKGLWKIIEAPDNPDETHLPPELRRQSRFQIPVSVLLETLDEEGLVTGTEMTVTENISLSGAAVFTTLKVEVGSFLRVTSQQYDTTIIAVVRGKRTGPDGIPRLHLEFIDHYFPLEGIE